MAAPTRLILAQRPAQPLEMICARLRDWGCDLLDCSSHGAAVAALGADSPDMVLIDAWLENGMTLLTQVKADPYLRYLPVVIAAPEDAAAVAAHALARGADDVLVLPIDDAELFARIRALSRLASMEIERRRREAVLSQFGVTPPPEMPGVPAIDRIGILLIGPAGGDQIQAMTALGGAATAAYAETAESALERLRRDDLDVALITGSRDHGDVQRLCAAIRADVDLFDLPVLLVGRPDAYPDRALPFDWGVSDVLFQPFQPEVLRLRVQSWVRQQRLRRRLRGALDGSQLPPTTDRLTRLHGHGFLHGYVEHLIRDNLRSQTPLALASFDVLGMGQINRLHGYAAGDWILAQLGRRHRTQLPRRGPAGPVRRRPLLPGDRWRVARGRRDRRRPDRLDPHPGVVRGRRRPADRRDARDRQRRARAGRHRGLADRPRVRATAAAPSAPGVLSRPRSAGLRARRPAGPDAARPCTGRRWPTASSR